MLFLRASITHQFELIPIKEHIVPLLPGVDGVQATEFFIVNRPHNTGVAAELGNTAGNRIMVLKELR